MLIKLLNRGTTANHFAPPPRMARRRKPVKKRRGKGSTDSSSSIHNSVSSDHMEMDNSLVASEDVDSLNCTVIQLDAESELRRSRVGSKAVEGDEDGEEGLLRLPEMADTSMDTVGQPLRDVMDRLNGALDREEAWEHLVEVGEKNNEGFDQGPEPPAQQPFREDSGGEPPDRAPGETCLSSLATSPNFLQTSPATTDLCCFAPFSPDSTSSGGGHYDSTEHGQSQTLSGGLEGEGEAKAAAGQGSDVKRGEEDAEEGQETDKNTFTEEATEIQEEKLSPSESSHPAEFK